MDTQKLRPNGAATDEHHRSSTRALRRTATKTAIRDGLAIKDGASFDLTTFDRV